MSLERGQMALEALEKKIENEVDEVKKRLLKEKKKQLYEKIYTHLQAYDRVKLARMMERPNIYDYIDSLITDFIELHGDRGCKDDQAVVGGIGFFLDLPVTIIGHCKGHDTLENIEHNFGMASPEGYRKAWRLMEQAERFKRPILLFVDTPGAYPGDEAEMHGQGEAIASMLERMFELTVPVITVVTGEGGSGGALAFSVANRILMLENAVYSVLSPEGFASILYKDASKAQVVSEYMKLTSFDLKEAGIVDEIIPEPLGSITTNPQIVYQALSHCIKENLDDLMCKKSTFLQKQKYDKFRKIGQVRYE